ncbi:hypothetical protein MRX96_008748 [Rhipicephalus microplus]
MSGTACPPGPDQGRRLLAPQTVCRATGSVLVRGKPLLQPRRVRKTRLARPPTSCFRFITKKECEVFARLPTKGPQHMLSERDSVTDLRRFAPAGRAL